MLLCDNIIAGYFIGESGVAAINAVTPVTGIVTFFSTVISIGSGILYSREIGAMNKRRADEIYFSNADVILEVQTPANMAATALLARDLKEALGRDGAVSILLPEMPPIAEAALSAGDSGDESCFQYEKAGNGWQITGLSEEGRDRTKLTVPTAHEGLPVLGFSAETFAGSPVLEELTLQENIRQIPDGAFSGCTALARIVLTQTAPAACSVGRGLLDGTDVRIYVPDGCLSAYATDYFWAVHARRLRTSQTAEAGLKEEAILAPRAAPGGNEILYLANGGHLRRQEGDSVTRAMDNSHRRVNTLQGGAWFEREGYVLTSWSTAPDGSGEQIGLGSRTERRQGLRLYARWEAAAPPEAFRWEEQRGEARITAWLGGDGRCVIPEELGGLPGL